MSLEPVVICVITGEDGIQHYEAQARLAILDKQFKTAEGIYLDYNNLDAAMEMYQSLHKWDEGNADGLNFAHYYSNFIAPFV